MDCVNWKGPIEPLSYHFFSLLISLIVVIKAPQFTLLFFMNDVPILCLLPFCDISLNFVTFISTLCRFSPFRDIVLHSMVFCIILWCFASFYGVLHHSMVFCIILWCFASFYGVLHHSMVFCIILWCFASFYGVLHHSMMFCRPKKTRAPALKRTKPSTKSALQVTPFMLWNEFGE